MSAIPSGPAVCPLPASTSISIILSRISLALISNSLILVSDKNAIKKFRSMLNLLKPLDCINYIIRIKNCGADDKPIRTCID